MTMMELLYLLLSLGTVMAVETLQSQIDYSSSSSTVSPVSSTTTPPWPKLSLTKFTGSPTAPWGETHTRAMVGPETTTTTERQVEVEVEIVTPVLTVPGDQQYQYQRHMLPYISDNTHWNTRDSTDTNSNTNTIPPTRRQKYRRIIRPRRKEVEVVEVSIPKIFVDMAFTGHYSRISVPRSRVR